MLGASSAVPWVRAGENAIGSLHDRREVLPIKLVAPYSQEVGAGWEVAKVNLAPENRYVVLDLGSAARFYQQLAVPSQHSDFIRPRFTAGDEVDFKI